MAFEYEIKQLKDRMICRELPETNFEQKVRQLERKWGFDYRSKTVFFNPNEEQTDEQLFHEVNPHRMLRILPECLVDFFLNLSGFKMTYENGAPTSSYDPYTNRAEIKSSHDTLHELGHALWYNLIEPVEEIERITVVNAFSPQGKKKVSARKLPKFHKQFAVLIGAYSGQFLKKECSDYRMNDLEELFARNLDYLIKGKPLTALPSSPAILNDFLKFYEKLGIIDHEFHHFYRFSMVADHDGKGLLKIPISDMQDGDYITSKLIERILELRTGLILEDPPKQKE